jgi:putative hydrolase of the HAD superfamily
VRLLLVDLDNTLIDRAAAFRSWAEDFVARRGGTAEAIEWLVAIDEDGFAPRESVTARIRDRFGVDPTEFDIRALRRGLVERVRLETSVAEALTRARSAGWLPFIVTNGTTEQQETKIRVTGLDALVAGWIISEGVGVKKPDPRVFRAAADAAGLPLEGAWMVGDSAHADIRGGHDLGLQTAWLRRGRTWTDPGFTPTLTVESFPDAIDRLGEPEPALSR